MPTKEVAKPARQPDLDRYCRKQIPIVIRNNTECILMLSFTDAKGHDRVVKVPNGKLPFSVSDYVSHRLISDNNDFRRLVAEKHVTLLNPAKTDMSKKARASSEFTVGSDNEDGDTVTEMAIEQEVIDASPQVAFAVASVESKDMTPRDFMVKMEDMTAVLTDKDLVYVNNELGKKFPKIGDWATTTLADLRDNHPERCTKPKKKKLTAKNAHEIVQEAADEDAGIDEDDDLQAEASVKKGVAAKLKLAQRDIGSVGSAKSAAKAMLDGQAAKRQHGRAR